MLTEGDVNTSSCSSESDNMASSLASLMRSISRAGNDGSDPVGLVPSPLSAPMQWPMDADGNITIVIPSTTGSVYPHSPLALGPRSGSSRSVAVLMRVLRPACACLRCGDWSCCF